MNSEEFNKFLEIEFADIRAKLKVKGAEYAPEETQSSRFHNFQTAAALNGESMEKALWGFATKHIVSLSDMIKDVDAYSLHTWEEKIGDVVNYMLLLKAMLVYEFNIQKLVTQSLADYQKESSALYDPTQPNNVNKEN